MENTQFWLVLLAHIDFNALTCKKRKRLDFYVLISKKAKKLKNMFLIRLKKQNNRIKRNDETNEVDDYIISPFNAISQCMVIYQTQITTKSRNANNNHFHTKRLNAGRQTKIELEVLI